MKYDFFLLTTHDHAEIIVRSSLYSRYFAYKCGVNAVAVE